MTSQSIDIDKDVLPVIKKLNLRAYDLLDEAQAGDRQQIIHKTKETALTRILEHTNELLVILEEMDEHL